MRRAERSEILALDHREPELAGLAQIGRGVDRSAHPGLNRRRHVEEAFFDGSLEGRAVEVLLAEVRLPRVGVRVELHERERAVLLRQDAQLGERDRVVATERDGKDTGLDDRRQSFEHLRVRTLDVSGRDR